MDSLSFELLTYKKLKGALYYQSIKNRLIILYKPKNLAKVAILAIILILADSTIAQDGTIYALDAPAEPNAILLGKGGVDDQPASETWFRQWATQWLVILQLRPSLHFCLILTRQMVRL